MQNAQPITNCAMWILKVDYLSISKPQKNFGVSKMQGGVTIGHMATRLLHVWCFLGLRWESCHFMQRKVTSGCIDFLVCCGSQCLDIVCCEHVLIKNICSLIPHSVCDTKSVIIAIRPENPVRGRSIVQWKKASLFDRWFYFILLWQICISLE